MTLISLFACDLENNSNPVTDPDVLARLDALEAENDELRAQVDACVTATDLAGYATEAYVDAGDATTLASAEAYADSGDEAAVADAQAWVEEQGYLRSVDFGGYATEDWVEEQGYASTSYVDNGDATTLASAESYADGGDATTLASAESYADGGDATTLASAETYADGGDATTLSAAEAWCDSGDVDTLASAQSYADGGDAETVAWVEGQAYATADALADLEDEAVRIISADTTWSVATDSEFIDAVAALDSYHLAADATLTIQLAAGDYYPPSAITFHHPDGGRIRLVGDEAYPNNVNLYFTGAHGIVVDEGSSLGYLGGLSMYCPSADCGNAVYVSEASSLQLGAINIDGFDYGVSVTGASYIEGNGTSTAGWLTINNVAGAGVHVSGSSAAYLGAFVVEGAGAFGAWVSEGSYLDGDYSTVAAASGGGLYYGYCVDRGSGADLEYSAAEGFEREGYYAGMTAWIDAHESDSTDNRSGYLASGGSSLTANYSSASSNLDSGFLAEYGSVLTALAATSSANEMGFVATGGSYVSATDSATSGSYYAYVSSSASSLFAGSAEASGTVGKAYYQEQNSYVYAVGVTSDNSTTSQSNDVTDFIYGL